MRKKISNIFKKLIVIYVYKKVPVLRIGIKVDFVLFFEVYFGSGSSFFYIL